MTLPDFLQYLAIIVLCFTIAFLASCIGSDAATWTALFALTLIIVAFIIKTDHKPRWHR